MNTVTFDLDIGMLVHLVGQVRRSRA